MKDKEIDKRIKRYGIFMITSLGFEHVSYLKLTKEERDKIWDEFSSHFRNEKQMKKVIVEIYEEK